MAAQVETKGRGGSGWRIAGWGGAVALLLLPFAAMQFTDEVEWTSLDFIVFGVMLSSAGLGLEFLVRRSGSAAYRCAAAIAIVTAFLLLWVNLAVGIIGTEDNDANWMFIGVLALGIVGSVVARFEPAAMARALFATAIAQLGVGAIALIGRMGVEDPSWPGDVLGLTGIFTLAWLASAGLFQKAAEDRAARAAG
jgi:hypothetical protein